MASKGPRSKLDHESRAKRQRVRNAIEAPLCRPKTHWDHVLEEMVWLSRDFERERKWKLGQAKRVALKASKGNVDQATRGEKRVKEEEQRSRKVAFNISKDVKKFWTKIEKLVLYKHQLELDEKKKKALDKQLEFLLGQTERYSSMLAENLVISSPALCKASTSDIGQEKPIIQWKGDDNITQTYESDTRSQSNIDAVDEDYSLQSEDESEDDEHTIEVDEALITKDEREEELAALHNEIDLPLDEILKRYAAQEVGSDKISDNVDNASGATNLRDNNGKDTTGYIAETDRGSAHAKPGRRCVESNGMLFVSESQISEVKTYEKRNSAKKLLESEKKQMWNEFNDEQEDDDFVLSSGDESDYGMDDETTLLAEEELANADPDSTLDEIDLLLKESEISVEELLARYKKDINMNENGGVDSESSYASPSGSSELGTFELKQPDDKTNGFHPDICPHLEEGETGFLGTSKDVESEEDVIADAAAAARSAQPTGNTFLTTNVRTKFPFLLKYPLREYQHIGLDWLVTMYDKRLNGILADEMGLGKTIMTIALLAHLACEKGIWGPHLIVVPTSVMLNWETEFLKWCPAFKILTYFGSAKERKIKRQGWLKPNSFHICITTYRLVIQDSKVFKRKKWKYLILDEAHLIKNWKSQRWQTLLNFNSKRRILLTGTPLQNDLMELWSLMHFLMPHVFQSHQEFKEWFSNPISGMADGQERVNREVVDRLHNVLRPFILRRLKRDVEKQLPMKREHVIYSRLSRRQRNLYEDFIASSETQATLASSNFFGMISVIMQLRKVCNHPDLFEGRPIVSSYDMSGLDVQLSSSVCSMLSPGPFSTVDLSGLGFVFTHLDFSMTSWESEEIQAIATPSSLINHHVKLLDLEENQLGGKNKKKIDTTNIFEDIQKSLLTDRLREAKERAAAIAWWNSLRCKKKPMYTSGLRELVSVRHPVFDIHLQKNGPMWNQFSSKLADIVLSPVDRFGKIVDHIESFMFAIPAARTPAPVCWCSKGGSPVIFDQSYKDRCSQVLLPLLTPFRSAIVRRQVYFPDRRLVQFDCGKLQQLALLLRRLKSEGHRALIFTQMTKMLDILEAFINLYGYTYMRLDGSTPPEERQTLMQRFNTNPKIFLFILSTRSGGVGINLVGADTVIFYDSDWNPAMDQQAQDRCHRIGQTREVNIYRLISESTIEENILKKANQKRVLDDLVIQSGSYNTEFFKKLDPMELFSGHRKIKDTEMDKSSKTDVDISLSNLDLDAALKNAEDEADYMAMKKVEEEEAVDNQEFTEEAIVKLEDDELVNEDEMKPDDSAEHSAYIAKSDGDNVLNVSHQGDEGPLSIDTKEDDIDMLVDVKHMAATAAAAGQEIFSFEKQLRPIDQYAVRFLELWDPIIDKAAVESNILVEEQEWELERIEKLKNDMEAEIDDEEEPLMYEKWDTDFATEVYRQQIETLAQHQLMEDQEREAQEKAALEAASLRNDIYVPSKKKKKAKKTKFKSLKKGALSSKAVSMKEESSLDQLSIGDDYDENFTSSDELSPPCSTHEKKCKHASDDERRSGRKAKKLKASELDEILLYPKSFSKHRNEQKDLRICDADVVELEPTQISRSKNRGKLSISVVPLKRVFTIKPEKLKKKVNIWSTDFFSHPDPWSADEDVVLCAVVYEYGPNWNLASEILYGMTAGGCYRGRFRHPVHCSERVRELIQRYVLSPNDATNKDKAINMSSGKALLRVTEDNMRLLLGITSELSDHERLLQNHFFAVISATWRNPNRWRHRNGTRSSQQDFSSSVQLFGSMINKQSSLANLSKKLEFTSLRQCGKSVEAALNADCNHETNDRVSIFEELPQAEEQLDVMLELQGEKDEALPIPSLINVSIPGPILPQSLKMYAGDDSHVRPLRVERQCSIVSGSINENCPSVESHIDDTRACSQVKSKIPPFDSPKLSKQKPRKASKNVSDLHTPAATHEVFTHLPKTPTDLSELSSCFLPEAGSIEFELNWHLDMDEERTSSLDSLQVFPVDNQSDLTIDLDDWSVLPEFTDIG